MSRIKKIIISFVITLVIVCLFATGIYLYQRKTETLPIFTPISSSSKPQLLASALEEAGFKLESLPRESEGSIIASVSGTLVIFSASEDFKDQVKALQLTIGSLKMEEPREIDLRFDKVIVRY